MSELVYFVVSANEESPMPLSHEYFNRLFFEKMEREGTDEVRDSSGHLEMERDDWEGEPYESYYEEAHFVGPWYVDVYNTKADAADAIQKQQDARRWLAEHPSKRESDLDPGGRVWYEKYPEYANRVRFSKPYTGFTVASMPKRDWKALEQWHELIGSTKDSDIDPADIYAYDRYHTCHYDHESLFGGWVTFEDGTFRVDFNQLIRFLSDKERATLERIKPLFKNNSSLSFSKACQLADVDRKTARKFQKLGLLPWLATQGAE